MPAAPGFITFWLSLKAHLQTLWFSSALGRTSSWPCLRSFHPSGIFLDVRGTFLLRQNQCGLLPAPPTVFCSRHQLCRSYQNVTLQEVSYKGSPSAQGSWTPPPWLPSCTGAQCCFQSFLRTPPLLVTAPTLLGALESAAFSRILSMSALLCHSRQLLCPCHTCQACFYSLQTEALDTAPRHVTWYTVAMPFLTGF